MASNDRYPRFELHIVPLMRLLDLEKMLTFTGLDLSDYDTVRRKASEIYGRIQTDMPWTVYGGLWPKEWVQLFKRWIDTGFKRLDLGKPSFPYQASREKALVTVIGASVVPDDSYEGWLQPALVEGGGREYTLYWQEPDLTPTPPLYPKEVVFEETFSAPLGLASVFIRDADGRHEIPIEAAMTATARKLKSRAQWPSS